MSKSITILDKDYTQWIQELSSSYRRIQIKAAMKVNEEMLRFYWSLGRDIVEMKVEERWGEGVIKSLSIDLQREIPNAKCFSRTNLYYMKKMYSLYSPIIGDDSLVINSAVPNTSKIVQQDVGQNDDIKASSDVQHLVGQRTEHNSKISWEITELVQKDIFSIPWGHHLRIIDKCSDNLQEALFYIHQTVLNGWSRDMLLNFIDTDLYHRQGKALSNFDRTLPEMTSDLAQEITKDPYNFAFTGITGRYNERLLKDKLLNNITQFLVELGTGFAYVGKEYRIEVGDTEKFIDLQSQPVVLYSNRSKDRKVRVRRLGADRRVCGIVQPHFTKRRSGQSYYRITHMQGERPYTSPVCIGIKQSTHRIIRIRTGEILSRESGGNHSDNRGT